MVNCNPETVSTDYDTSDRLYFEPLTFEDVLNIVEREAGRGQGRGIGGTPAAPRADRAIWRADAAQPGRSGSKRRARRSWARHPMPSTWPKIATVLATCWSGSTSLPRRMALPAAWTRPWPSRTGVGYPVVVRPSYVLGGRAMAIVDDEEALRRYMIDALSAAPERPILIDQFLEDAFEVDVDAICDGRALRHRRHHAAHRGSGHPQRRQRLRAASLQDQQLSSQHYRRVHREAGPGPAACAG